VVNYQIYNSTNSPQPLSASQRGAKSLTTPFLCLQENPARGIDEASGAGDV